MFRAQFRYAAKIFIRSRKFHRAPALVVLLVATGSAHAPLGMHFNSGVAQNQVTPPLSLPDEPAPPAPVVDASPYQPATWINSPQTPDYSDLTPVIDALIASTTPIDLAHLMSSANQDALADNSLSSNTTPLPDSQDPAVDLPSPSNGGPSASAGGGGGGISDGSGGGGGGGGGTPSAGTPVPEPTNLWIIASTMLAFFRPRFRNA